MDERRPDDGKELSDEALDRASGGDGARRILTQEDLGWLLQEYEPWDPAKHGPKYNSPFQYYISSDQKRIGELPPEEQWDAIWNYARIHNYEVAIPRP